MALAPARCSALTWLGPKEPTVNPYSLRFASRLKMQHPAKIIAPDINTITLRCNALGSD